MIRQFSVIPLLLLATACAGSPPQSLVDARAAYQRASQGQAAQLTPAQLHVAATSLSVAEQTYEDEGDSANARDRAYVAQRKAELAEVQAAIAAQDQRTALAAKQIEAAKARNQLATERELNSTRAQLAGERNAVASTQAELQGERQRRQDAERRAADAINQLAGVASIKQETRGTVITLSGAVIFASGKADLLPAARNKLEQVATALKQSEPETEFVVEGYTDSRGSAALNEELSTRRAATVRDYLVSQGVPAARITSKGLGPSNPVADNATAEGRANNRRVEIIVQTAENRSSQAAQTGSSPSRSANPGTTGSSTQGSGTSSGSSTQGSSTGSGSNTQGSGTSSGSSGTRGSSTGSGSSTQGSSTGSGSSTRGSGSPGGNSQSNGGSGSNRPNPAQPGSAR
jgi:outer membrane protein OmpA-like peptidoglycan-associated protein